MFGALRDDVWGELGELMVSIGFWGLGSGVLGLRV